jgi:hypothetical protein
MCLFFFNHSGEHALSGGIDARLLRSGGFDAQLGLWARACRDLLVVLLVMKQSRVFTASLLGKGNCLQLLAEELHLSVVPFCRPSFTTLCSTS